MAPIRNRPSTQALRPVRAMALVLVIASLLATSCTADEAVTDLEMRCQSVQCYIDCPADSYLPNTFDTNDEREVGTEPSETAAGSDRERRAIATNNRVHAPIQIVPSPYQDYFRNNLPAARRLKRNIDPTDLMPPAAIDYSENEPHLQELCCPKCVCQPCPEIPSCPPNFKLTIDAHDQTGQPGKCCPSYQCELHNPMCYSETNRTWYRDNESWQESRCTTCRCQAGVPRCVAPTCKPLNCEHQIDLPDRCCPVCDPQKSIFCEDHNCELRCRNGYERRGDCALCSCVQPSTNTTIDRTMPDNKPTETTALVANYTSGDVATTNTSEAGPAADDGFFNSLPTIIWLAIVIITILATPIIYSWMTKECVKEGLKMLFTCNQISQRKSAYNRVSSTVPVAPPANGTAAANSMA
ncbi:cysteine-rich motor neuron 1 protein isoform X1 [Anopheles moucheti]|uniref:cysteine-rich motor neuron 1 protein isoform X1 n=1 Tax=Anopheles moucheti TaxID=186751 RepID=UPI0022F0C6AB|nr:cysteine-rich motor neuron 1 protein isoform X1 [Anopheles moucheti]XP_052890270.1 cysteine-rich motor neuron 1 protein isoform X1 [Anopheles moucheti]XP_052890271.1 cysteine-rich motor neuron 1 protein isoform X1 [Anopheles moucheti]XP_052890273.1 cysteine-rich motor neuron 1 protein isoform X1 [Anopheles moucheti]XP_052890274.1 cysteine-rich motor neuron 1 protein isoform X1 [Anopheles moucheti]